MALFDDVRQNLEQEELQAVSRATTGKAGTVSSGPKMSQEGVAQAEKATQLQARAGRVEGAVAQQAQERQREMATQDYESKLQLLNQEEALAQQGRHEQMQLTLEERDSRMSNFLHKTAQERGIQLDNIFQQYKHSSLELEDREDAAELEQLAHIMALQDKEYANSLQQLWNQENLQDEVDFNAYITKQAFGDELVMLYDKLGFLKEMEKGKGDFTEHLAKIDLAAAAKIAKISASGEAAAQTISGAAQVGTSAAARYQANKPKPGKAIPSSPTSTSGKIQPMTRSPKFGKQ